MKKYVFFVFVFCTSLLFACPKVDKIREFIKKRLLELVDGNSRDLSQSEHQVEAEALLEVYDYLEKVDNNLYE